jgi:hypothetical protein
MGIDLPMPPNMQHPMSLRHPMQGVPDNHNALLPLPTDRQRNMAPEFDEMIQLPPLDSFSPDRFEISPEMLEAFSTLEPIDATVGSLRDFD